MKKLASILLFGFLSLYSFAQVSVRPGIKLGANYSTITNTDLDYKLGLQVGGVAIIRFNDLYALQPEILYTRQGGKSKSADLQDIKSNYLSFAVTNKFHVIPNNGFHVLLGPYFDFNVGDGIVNLNDSPDPSVNAIDFGFFAGLGYEFDFGLILETRYKNGIINVDLFSFENDERLNGTKNVLNSVFQFAAIYKFDF